MEGPLGILMSESAYIHGLVLQFCYNFSLDIVEYSEALIIGVFDESELDIVVNFCQQHNYDVVLYRKE